MPIYEYMCDDCGVRFERMQAVTEKPVRVCPECGGQVRKLIQPVGIIFKGSGFYVTDNRAKKSTTRDTSSSASSSEKKAAGSSESKKSEAASESSEKSD